MKLREVWGRIVKKRYTRLLEEEVARLRAENRALLNSILGIAGVPPVFVSKAELAGEGPRQEEKLGQTPLERTSQRTARPGQHASHSRVQRRMLGVPAPVRHRSWQQVNRMLELGVMRSQEMPATENLRWAGPSKAAGKEVFDERI